MHLDLRDDLLFLTVDYGFPINGILGMDFLLATGANLNLDRLELTFPNYTGDA